jgi:hypothetical protein
LQLSAILALTGCSSQDTALSDNADNYDSETQIVSSDKTSQSNSDSELAQQIEDICLEFVDNYYNGTIEKDFNKCFGNFPDFYLEMLEKEVEICGESHDEYMQGIYSDYAETYGDDFEITSRVADDGNGTKGILKLSDESTEDMKEIFKETYDKDVNLEEVYTVYVTTVTKGSADEYSDEEEWYILKIDGEYYLYERYYEENPIE